jgi:hypothetical protein
VVGAGGVAQSFLQNNNYHEKRKARGDATAQGLQAAVASIPEQHEQHDGGDDRVQKCFGRGIERLEILAGDGQARVEGVGREEIGQCCSGTCERNDGFRRRAGHGWRGN